MPVLLRLDSSADDAGSVSRRLTDAFAAQWRARGNTYTVKARDLHADPVPHLPSASLHWPARLRPAGAPELPEAEERQRILIDELLGADALLLAAPMYNYSLPSTLKAWMDHIHVPGLTAPFEADTQPLRGRPAVVVSTRGASYDAGSATESWDHVLPPLRLILETALGMHVETVAVSRTLSTVVRAMAGERGAFEIEYAAAKAELERLAASI
jgi:FMN-dependent NADH-azoreductase